jgi:hypothetical protein
MGGNVKRVRYAGTVALAPLVATIAVPAAAQAATTSASNAQAKTKAVVLKETAGPLTACTAHSVVKAFVGNSLLRGESVWFNPASQGNGKVCVGTVIAHRYFLHTNCISMHYNVYYTHNNDRDEQTLRNLCGNAGQSKAFNYRFGQTFSPLASSYVAVCISSEYGQTSCTDPPL